ncbi:hypothetical protein DIURU_002883 [Diutina rugosa]|uniref:ATP-dependent RNA helicase n=1 Tax=Diutina rugosa TaxID=5481 RepID=A0A642UNR3_DIURU|nr:uncharacterized protein DIURU_002883 [Diutina rugosa]KAA8902429.1 hypothetical protein DIURU_002883 [Diutina rugosa]
MDGDDGLLLNFAAPSASQAPAKAPKVVGGRWRDRRKMQLALEGREITPKTRSDANSEPVAPRKPRSESGYKGKNAGGKPRERKPRAEPGTDHLGPRLGGPKSKYTEGRGSDGKGNTYVSSLFTHSEASKLELKKNTVKYAATNAPLSADFNDLGLNERLVTHLNDNLRFKHPTRVQQLVVPRMVASSQDLFIKAQTGSGKTLSFVLPILHSLMESERKIHRESGVFAIILTPTRELAHQIYSVLESLTKVCHYIVPGIVIGGEKKKSEKARLRKGVNILVGTPGRLADHIDNTKSFSTAELRWLVLDEGDKLMELGFEETIKKITDKIENDKNFGDWPGLPTDRTNVLCSATIQANVKKLGNIVLHDPEMVSVDGKSTVAFNEESQRAPDQLTQEVVVAPAKLRLVTLAAKLRSQMSTGARVIVFLSCSDSVDFHFTVFTKDGHRVKLAKPTKEDSTATIDTDGRTSPFLNDANVFKLHGSLSQPVRSSTLSAFIKCKSPAVLFCTDVAARGLDIPNITSVVEYDPPFTIDDHLHRIGRSARVGNDGHATLFLLPIEETYVDKLNTVHKGVDVVDYKAILTEFGEGAKKTEWDTHATTWHLNVERWLLEDEGAKEQAIKAFTSHIRAYTTHLNSEKNYFNVKSLHLGHLAKSFGLRETPKKLGGTAGTTPATKRKAPKEDSRTKMLRMAKMAVRDSTSDFNY